MNLKKCYLAAMKAFVAFLGFLLLCFSAPVVAQTAPPELKTYYLVLLKRGPNRGQDAETVAQLQAGHMANIQKMAEAGKLHIAGPIAEDSDLRGIFILNTATEAEARALVDADPAVAAGRLVYEIHPWMSQPGSCLK